MTDKFYRIILASLLVTSTWWRHCLTLHFFSVNTVPVIPIAIWVKETTAVSPRIYLWKMPCGKGWKWHCRETKFRNFLEEHPSLKRLQRSNFSSRAYTYPCVWCIFPHKLLERSKFTFKTTLQTVNKTLLTDLHIENTGASKGRPESRRQTVRRLHLRKLI